MNLTDKAKKTVRLISSIVLSVLLTVSAVLLIVSCCSIYNSGPSPFTRESISEAFRLIAVPLYITVIAVIVCGLIHFLIPAEQGNLKGGRSKTGLLDSLYSRLDFDAIGDEDKARIGKERNLRRGLSYANAALIALEIILPLIYLLNPSNFPGVVGEYNAEILHGILFYAVSLLPLFVFEVLYVVIVEKSRTREIDVIRSLMKDGAALKDGSSTDNKMGLCEFFAANRKPITLGVTIAFVGCAVGFIVAGVLNGGADSVLEKAVKICTECIGLG